VEICSLDGRFVHFDYGSVILMLVLRKWSISDHQFLEKYGLSYIR
jgi:hypothetical protein